MIARPEWLNGLLPVGMPLVELPLLKSISPNQFPFLTWYFPTSWTAQQRLAWMHKWMISAVMLQQWKEDTGRPL